MTVKDFRRIFQIFPLALILVLPWQVQAQGRNQDKYAVCLKTMSYLVDNTRYKVMSISQVIAELRKLRMSIDPLASPDFKPISGSSIESQKKQQKVAKRLRGIEVFGLKVGEGAELLDPSSKTLGLVVEGRKNIQSFFEHFDEICVPLYGATYAFAGACEKMAASFLGGLGVAIAGVATTQDVAWTGPIGVLPALTLAWLTQKHMEAENGFHDFKSQVMSSLDSKEGAPAWAHYGQQAQMFGYEKDTRMENLPNPIFSEVTSIGYDNSLLFKMLARSMPKAEVMVDYTFINENGQPKLVAVLRTSGRKMAGRPRPREKNELLEKAKGLVKKPVVVPVPAGK